MINYVWLESSKDVFETPPPYFLNYLKRIKETPVVEQKDLIEGLLEYVEKKKGIESFEKYRIWSSLTKNVK